MVLRIYKNQPMANKTTQREKTLTAKPYALRTDHEAHIIQGENPFPLVAL